MVRFAACAAAVALLAPAPASSEAAPVAGTVPIDVHAFHPVEGPATGPKVYYEVVDDPTDGPLLRATYRPGLETVTMGAPVPDELRTKVQRVRWRWRARTFPTEGDECRPGYGDSAAAVFITFKRGIKWYIVKFAWTMGVRRGTLCDRKRNLTMDRDTIVLESDGPTGVWRREEVDVRLAYLRLFAKRPGEPIPDLVGIGVMTDGDQTQSVSSADYAGFEIVY